MKTYKQWISEVTNASAGAGVRGFGDVTGQPAGDISGYAAANANAPQLAQAAVDQHNGMHTDALQAGIDADTKDNLLKKKK